MRKSSVGHLPFPGGRRRIWRRIAALSLPLLIIALFVLPLSPRDSEGASLSVAISGSGQGTVNSSPSGIACPGSCSGVFSDVRLLASPSSSSLFRGWGGACAGLEECLLTVAADQTVQAFFDPKPTSLRVSGSYYGALQVAYNSAQTGGTIQVVAKDQPGDLSLGQPVRVSLAGGYDDPFAARTGTTRIRGKVKIQRGRLDVSRISVAASVPAPSSAPAAVTAVAGDGAVTLSWDDPLGATSYNVYYSTSPGVTRATGTKVAGAASGQTVSGLTNGTTYYFVVTAVSATGESVESAQVFVAPVHIAPPVPAVPFGVVGLAGNGTVTVSWSAVTGATSYNIYWSNSPGVTASNGTKISGISEASYRQSGVTNGKTYYYVVTAVNGAAESAPSAEVSAKPMSAPPVKLIKMSVYKGEVLNLYTLYQYDSAGRKKKESMYDNAGNLESENSYEYDPSGRPTKVSTYIYGMLMAYTTTEYNSAGKPTRVSSYGFDGTRTGYVVNDYDKDGFLVKSSSYNGEADLLLLYVTFENNAAGDVTRAVNYDFAGHVLGSTTTEYDAAGNEVKVSSFGPTGLLEEYVVTEYNAAGKPAKQTTYNGQTGNVMKSEMYEYNAAGKLVRRNTYDFAGNLTKYQTTDYNEEGKMTKVVSYDDTGLITSMITFEYGN